MATQNLKLFVVGESSGNPDDWSMWSEWSLVLAEDAHQAVELAGEIVGYPVAEVDMSKPRVLVTMPEPSWGDDL